MTRRDVIRNEINEFCMENVFNSNMKYAGFGSSPMAIVIYLGDKTVDDLEDQMKGAFGSLLNIKPEVRGIYINEANIASESVLRDSLIDIFTSLNEQGLLVRDRMIDIRISFIAVMDDPLFKSKAAVDGIYKMREQLDEIQALNIVHLGNTSFFGIFDQKVGKKKYDYDPAFRFVTEGSKNKCNLWQNIYHLQKVIYESSYESAARTAAMKVLRDSIYPNMRKGEKKAVSDDYCWDYIGMDEMKLPELLICNILINAYEAQLIDMELSAQEKQQFKDSLEETLLGYIRKSCEILNTSDWVRYLPMNVQPMNWQGKESLFSRKRKEAYGFIDYSQMLVKQQMLDAILTECTEGKVDELRDPDQFLKVVRGAFKALHRTDTALPRLRISLMEAIGMLTKNLEYRVGQIELNGSTDSEETYFQELYRRYSDKEILDIAIEVLKSCFSNHLFEEKIGRLLKNVKDDSENTRQILAELRINSYGGAHALKLPNLVHNLQISIDTPVQDACEAIDRRTLDTLVRDEAILKENAAAFLSKAQESSTVRNSIGQVSGDKTMSPLEYEVFVSQSLEENGMQIFVNNVFRANTMQVLSYCEWSSVKNLATYYRGE